MPKIKLILLILVFLSAAGGIFALARQDSQENTLPAPQVLGEETTADSPVSDQSGGAQAMTAVQGSPGMATDQEIAPSVASSASSVVSLPSPWNVIEWLRLEKGDNPVETVFKNGDLIIKGNGTLQLQNGAVTASTLDRKIVDSEHIATGAINSRTVEDGSITAEDLAANISLDNLGSLSATSGAFSQSVTIAQDLTVNNDATISGDLTVSDNTTVSGDLTVAGELALGSDLTVNGHAIDPELAGSTSITNPGFFAVVGNYAYNRSSTNDAFEIYEVTDDGTFTLLGSTGGPVPGTSIPVNTGDGIIQGNYAYITDRTQRSVTAIDISNPSEPVFVGQLIDNTKLNGAQNMSVSGKYLYVSTVSRRSLAIVDISDPTDMKIVGELTFSNNLQLRGTALRGNYLYGNLFISPSNILNAFAVIDVSDPTDPELVASTTGMNPGPSFSNAMVHLSGKYAFVTSFNGSASGTVAVVDISDPADPTQVAELTDESFAGAYSSFFSDDYLYVGNASGDTFNVVDVSDPLNPTLITQYEIPSFDGTLGNGLVIFAGQGNRAYIQTQNGDLAGVVNISAFTAPQAEIGTLAVYNLLARSPARFLSDVDVLNGLNVSGDSLFGGNLSIQGGSVNPFSAEPALTIPYGAVGIGTDAPGVRFHVVSDADEVLLRLEDSDGTCDFNPESGGLTPSCSSDARLKENIRDTGSALEYLEDLRIRDYEVLSSGDTQTGVIAQEVLATHPELVTEGEDGLYKVAQINIWKIVKAVQELWQLTLSFADSFTTEKLCVGTVCVTEAEFLQMIESSGATPLPAEEPLTDELEEAMFLEEENDGSPIIEIEGENPVVLELGASYVDAGARVTGPGDKDRSLVPEVSLGSTPFDGTLDTSVPATYYIHYTATNDAGSAIATRIVIVGEGGAEASISESGEETEAAPLQ